MIAYLLIIYVGGHSGYITVPGIRTLAACNALAQEIHKTPQGPYLARAHSCLQYEIARH